MILLLCSITFAQPASPAPNANEHSITQSETTPHAELAKDDHRETPSESAVETPADSVVQAPANSGSGTGSSQATPRNPASYKLWVLLPAAVAIILAIFLRQVVPALVVGILVGAYMLAPCLPANDALRSSHTVVTGFRLAVERYVIGAIHEPPDKNFAHIKVIIFTLVIGFTVGVIGRNGGTAGMVRVVGGETRSPRRGAFTAWLAGLVVFFDDYANTMIVGPTMRPVFDRLKISRAKLAYIVDSTAAPVASIALIGTWVGAEIGYIEKGIDAIKDSVTPAFLLNQAGQPLGGMETFLGSLGYRFYPILAILLVLLVVLTNRDFGPMRKSQRRAARNDGPSESPSSPQGQAQGAAAGLASSGVVPRAWLGFLPILTLVGVTMAVLVFVGLHASGTVAQMTATAGTTVSPWDTFPFWRQASLVISNSDSYIAILYGAVFSAIGAVILSVLSRVCSVKEATEAGIAGMTNMFPAVVILVFAWAISAVLQDLKLGEIVSARLHGADFPAQWLPLTVFATAAGISFATGTSWGTMGILCPMTVEIAARLCVNVDPSVAQSLFFASVGSVLAGAIFGDHCSPISDTTVLSSIASGCPHEEHVWTQLPYALVTAVVAMGVGDVLCSVFRQPWYVGIGAGTVALILVVLIFGREVEPRDIRDPATASI